MPNTRACAALSLLVCVVMTGYPATAASTPATPSVNATYDFCVIGAGPGGLQTARLLQQLGMRYVVLERHAHAGSFFDVYPRQRQLISINKVHTGSDDAEFNLRHDWNSLLDGFTSDAGPRLEPAAEAPDAGPTDGPPPDVDGEVIDGDEPPASAHEASPIAPELQAGLARAQALQARHRRLSAGRLDGDATDATVPGSGSPAQHGDSSNKTPPVLFREFSRKYYPHADDLVRYLRAFADRHQLNVRYQHDVVSVTRSAKPRPPYRNSASAAALTGNFLVEYRDTAAAAASPHHKKKKKKAPSAAPSTDAVACRVVVLSNGKDVAKMASPKRGAHLVTPYRDVPSTNMSQYDDQEVLVIGSGNAALEVARALEEHAAHVHVYSRHVMQMAHQTHYVGHARAVNLGILDRYQLKSLDLVLSRMPDIAKVGFVHDPPTQRILLERSVLVPPEDEPELPPGERRYAARVRESHPGRRGYHAVIACLGFTVNMSAFFGHDPDGAQAAMATRGARPRRTKRAPGSRAGPELVLPLFDRRRGMPIIASNYESVNEPHLFVAGSLMHYRDFKRSAGGFIHGFRYLARTLVLGLRERYAGVPYPAAAVPACTTTTTTTAPVAACVDALTSRITARLRNVSSLYQMQGVLADVIYPAFATTASSSTSPSRQQQQQQQPRARGATTLLHVLEDIPLDVVNSTNPDKVSPAALAAAPRFITLSLEFGPHFHGRGIMHHQGEQRELITRQFEKWGWNVEDDPDELLHSGEYPRGLPPAFLRAMPETSPNPAFEPLPPLYPLPQPDMSDPPTSFDIEPPARAKPQPKEGGGDPTPRAGGGDADGDSARFGKQFLHPVLRYWERGRRSGDASSSRSTRVSGEPVAEPATLVAQLRLFEEPLNEWTLPVTHVEPLQAFLRAQVKRMLK